MGSIKRCQLLAMVVLISSMVLLSSCVASKVGGGRRLGLSRDIKIDEITTKKDDTETNIEKKNSTSSIMSLLMSEKWITPRFTHPLTEAFNSIGLPATVLAGVGLVVLLPIFLIAAGSSWLPLQKVSNLPIQDEPDYANYFYKAPAPAPETYWASAAAPAPSPSHSTHTIMYSYPPAPAPAPSPKHHYGYPTEPAPAPAPSPKHHYGYPTEPAPAPAPSPKHHYGYPPAPAPAPTMQQYYSPPAPAPAPSIHYGYPEAPAPSVHYGFSSDPMPSVNYAYQPAIMSAPSPVAGKSSNQPPPSNSYVIDSNNNGKVGTKEDSTSKVTSRKERSASAIKYVSDDQCVQRLACEFAKVAKGWRLPSWMNTVANVIPLQDNNLIQESRKLLSSDCSHFQCDSYEIVKTAL